MFICQVETDIGDTFWGKGDTKAKALEDAGSAYSGNFCPDRDQIIFWKAVESPTEVTTKYVIKDM